MEDIGRTLTITRRTDYGVRLMYELGKIPFGATLSVRDLCEAADVPASFGASLVPFLVDGGLVETQDSQHHLLSLARPAADISMADVICSCEPAFSLAACVDDPHSCGRSAGCGIRGMWATLDAVVWSHLRAMTLETVSSNRALPPEIYAQHLPDTRTGLTVRSS